MIRKIKILYDPQMFDLQNYGGITRYFANLIKGIQQSGIFETRLPLIYSTNYCVRDFPQRIKNNLIRSLIKKLFKRNKWNLNLASSEIRKNDFDLFHATYYNPYFLKDLKKPLVVTVHDMIHENYPSLFGDAPEVIQQKKTVIEAADLLIAISNYTKQQILKYYPHLENRIKVVYHGIPETEITPATDSLPEKYLLYVGDRTTKYKNFIPFVSAIAPLLKSNSGLKLICAGGNDFNTSELNNFNQLGISAEISQLNATDAQLVQLYQQAMVFIYPSLEEGFGLPLLEAFKNGCPIACSDSSCLPEVGGNAVSYFDPLNLHAIHACIDKLITDPKLREKRRLDGYQQVKLFTFEKCLNETIACYQSLLP